jgi:hypothetical protein
VSTCRDAIGKREHLAPGPLSPPPRCPSASSANYRLGDDDASAEPIQQLKQSKPVQVLHDRRIDDDHRLRAVAMSRSSSSAVRRNVSTPKSASFVKKTGFAKMP